MKHRVIGLLICLLLVSCGIGGISGNEMTSERAYKSLVGFTQTDEQFLKYAVGQSMGEVIGIVKTGESKVEIVFTLINAPCDGCAPTSNGKASAFVTTDGKWILDCITYANAYGDSILGRQSCNLNRDMDELAQGSASNTAVSEVDRKTGETETVHSSGYELGLLMLVLLMLVLLAVINIIGLVNVIGRTDTN